ncbi:MAG: GNAT family N-acetyltransferase [Anaerolineales bacterium]|nr:GNAT family N-acetyltransferase [Anaerolineales bacterium]
MNVEQILALFDQEQRRDVEFSDVRREVTPTVVRQVGLYHPESAIIYSSLTPDNVEAAIRAEIAYFDHLGHELEWKVYAHDTPSDLKDRLLTHGFEAEEPEALVVLDLESGPVALFQPVSHDVRRITNPDNLGDLAVVHEGVWQEDFTILHERLAYDLQQNPEDIGVYAAYVDGLPVSSAWIYFHEGSQFASLWGGSTLPAYRKRGLYSALLAVRAQEAHRRGVRFLTVDASPMSRPILQFFGFQWLTTIYPCKWQGKQR